ncbi:MAG: 3'(2'),5'-bisphosphate nucleotidase CysQ [Candidatus Nanoarchaeia archaeon]|nr:3'(2'),5'-bisphosphate nucleotidase CysQ [Candidatus Nanoarchaeia archaeon]
MNLEKELKIAREISKKAGEKIIEIYNSPDFEIRIKEDKTPVTKADLAATDIIVNELKKHFPDYGFLTEEEKDNSERLDKEYVWIIDPLDGTKEFIAKNGEFTVNIALVKNKEPILGIIYVPTKKETYYAAKNRGSFYELNNEIKKLNVSDKKLIEEMEVVRSRFNAGEKLLKFLEKTNFREIKVVGSSLKGCLIARGDADIYYKFGSIHEWDICAMTLVLEEAGGTITDLEGKRLVFNKESPSFEGFIASNNKIHQELVRIGKNG